MACKFKAIKEIHLACLVLIILIFASLNCSAAKANDRSKRIMKGQKIPIIGILTQVLRDYKRFVSTEHLHMASSYVKWIEAAGGQVLPILLNQEDSYYEQIFKQTNGLLFTGGDNLLDPNKQTPMMVAAKKLYKLAIEANNRGDFYPIWGTCLGLELLSVLSSNKNVLTLCSANDVSLPLEFVSRGRMFAPRGLFGDEDGFDYSKKIVDILKKDNITYNFHHFCLTDEGLELASLKDFYRPLAYSFDKKGLKFITVMEAINYPFYGVQFHPEKAAFEFVVKKGQHNIPHNSEAIVASRFLADFFANEAKLNEHQVEQKQVAQLLIYSHNATYTAPLNDMYEQRYLFPFYNTGKTSVEEFIHHVPEEDEIIPELVAY